MEQLTVAIDEARALNVYRDQQQAETLEKITKELEEQTALADAAEEDLAEVNENCLNFTLKTWRLFSPLFS